MQKSSWKFCKATSLCQSPKTPKEKYWQNGNFYEISHENLIVVILYGYLSQILYGILWSLNWNQTVDSVPKHRITS